MRLNIKNFGCLAKERKNIDVSVRNSSFRMKYKIIVDIKANENKNYLYQPASQYFVNTVDGWEAVLWVRIRMAGSVRIRINLQIISQN